MTAALYLLTPKFELVAVLRIGLFKILASLWCDGFDLPTELVWQFLEVLIGNISLIVQRFNKFQALA